MGEAEKVPCRLLGVVTLYASASQYCPRAAQHAATGRAAMHTPGAHSCVWGLEKAVPENKDAGKAFGAALVVRVKKKVI